MHKLENKTKARGQLGSKATKTKLTNMLTGKEREKRKNRYAKLIELDKEYLSTLEINCKKRTVEKANKEINVEKIIMSLKKVKLKRKGKKEKGKLHRTAKVQCRGRSL